MRIVTDTRPWKAAVSVDEDLPSFIADEWLRLSIPTTRSQGGPTTQLAAEAHFYASSMIPRGLLGGTFTFGGDALVIEIGALAFASGQVLESSFWGPFELGLSHASAHTVRRTLESEASDFDLPGGEFRLNVAGTDPLESSDFAFARAAKILLWALQSIGEDPELSLGALESFARSLTVDAL